MADYWKSQPRKFCQYCKCWIADNKPSIDFHERGKNHKENVAAKIEEIKKKSVAKAKQEKKMSKEFAKMEEAAQKAYEEDLKRLTSGESYVAPVPAPAPAKKNPPPKTKKSNFKAKKSSKIPSDVWVEGRTDDGQIYYYNTVTGESQWEKPNMFHGVMTSSSTSSSSSSSPAIGLIQGSTGGVWIEAVSPDGYTYYYNTETGESSWEKPDDFNPESSQEETQEQSAPPQPETLSLEEDTSESPKETTEEPADKPTEEPAENKQASVPKISFRKRKEETNPTSSDDSEGQKSSDCGKDEEKKETDVSHTVQDVVIPAKKHRKINPYGEWEQIQIQKLSEDDPYKNVDLQLPHAETSGTASTAPEVKPEPRPKFKERTITSLGDEGNAGATFKKRKTENGKSRSLRQRENDD